MKVDRLTAGLKNFSSKLTLVVPTLTSAHWLRVKGEVEEHLIDFYDDIGIKPMFVVEESTSQSTLNLLAAKGAAYMDVGFIPRGDSLIGATLAHNDTGWVLRVDADELPTPDALLLNCRSIVRSFLECLADLERYDGFRVIPRCVPFVFSALSGNVPESWHMFAPLPNQRHNEVAAALHQSRITAAAQTSQLERQAATERGFIILRSQL